MHVQDPTPTASHRSWPASRRQTFAEGKPMNQQRSKMPFRLNQMPVGEARDSSDAGIIGQSKNGNRRSASTRSCTRRPPRIPKRGASPSIMNRIPAGVRAQQTGHQASAHSAPSARCRLYRKAANRGRAGNLAKRVPVSACMAVSITDGVTLAMRTPGAGIERYRSGLPVKRRSCLRNRRSSPDTGCERHDWRRTGRAFQTPWG